MRELVIDLETTTSLIKKHKKGKIEWVSDKGNSGNHNNRIVCVGAYSMVTGKYTCVYLDGRSDFNRLSRLLAEHDTLVGHNLKYDVNWLRRVGFDVSGHTHVDTMCNEHWLVGGKFTSSQLKLDLLAPKYGGTNKVDIIKSLWDAGVVNDEIPRSLLSKYLYLDVWNTWNIYRQQKPTLK